MSERTDAGASTLAPAPRNPDDPTLSSFAIRVRASADAKTVVARRVVEAFLGSGQSIFLSDGTSTFYVAAQIFEKAAASPDRPYFDIYTNNLAVAHRFVARDKPRGSLERVRVYLPGGLVQHGQVLVGPEVEAKIEEWAARAGLAILSVSALFGDKGPVAHTPTDLYARQAALRGARRVVFVADHGKLSHPYAGEPLLYPAAGDWKGAMASPNTHVVTTKPPDIGVQDILSTGRNKADGPTGWYLQHRRQLASAMGERFTEIVL